MACYFKKKGSKIESTADIEGFLDIKYDDQKLIKDLMSGSATLSPPPAKKGAEAKGGGGGGGQVSDAQFDVGDYVVELAKSGRSKCRACGEKIETGELRCGTVERVMLLSSAVTPP